MRISVLARAKECLSHRRDSRLHNYFEGVRAVPLMPLSGYAAAASSLGSRARSLIQSASTYLVQATSDDDLSHSVSRSQAAAEIDQNQSWEVWARDRKPKKPTGTEKLTVVPGWAVKRSRSQMHDSNRCDGQVEPFDIHLLVSGFALRERNIEHASRTQRIFMRMARSLAALPALPATDESLFQQLDEDGAVTMEPATAPSMLDASFSFESMSAEAIEAAHANMNARLHPFWSSALPGRSIRMEIDPAGDQDSHHDALSEFNFATDIEGHFNKRLVITWEQLCTHPPSVAKAFAGSKSDVDWTLCVRASLLPEVGAADTTPVQSSIDERRAVEVIEQTVFTPVTRNGGLRVVCDLDDTVKRTDILSGLRTVIRNVFCAPLEGVCVAGFDDLFRRLAQKGVHFHFVSNSPIELYDVIAQFLRLHKFPEHASVRLKNYGQGRALFTSLVEAAGGRKKPSVMEALDAFSQASFLLIGDSGEEDLELYTEIARERPHQVVGILIRDVSPVSLEGSDLRRTNTQLGRIPPAFNQPRRQESASSASSSEDTDAQLSELSSAEQKVLERAAEWSERQARARHIIPEHIFLRVFHSVAEITAEALEVAEQKKKT